MRKFIFVVFTFVFCQMSAQVIVQDKTLKKKGKTTQETLYGVKGGLNINAFRKYDGFNLNTTVGAYMGVLAEYTLKNNFYFQPEALLSMQSVDIGAGNLDLFYINFPLLLKYHITPEFAAEIGPQIGYALSSNAENFNSINNVPLQEEPLQLGFNVGGGYRLNDNFYFQARLHLGLTKTLKVGELKNETIQFGLCYFL